MHRLASRMATIEPFHVMEVQSRARALEARGLDVIHLEIGEPDFRTPEPILRAATLALAERPMFYTSALGISELREAIAASYEPSFGAHLTAERVIVTAGASAGLLLALGVLIDPGDEVLLTDPGYPCNRHFVTAWGGEPRPVPVGPAERFQLTREIAERAWTPRTRAVLVASPSNPTGTSLPLPELRRLHELCRERGATLIVDEIYLGLSYDEAPRSAVELGEDVLVVQSFSKYFQMTGFRLGWLVTPPALTRAVEKLAQNLVISPSTVAQHAALAGFSAETREILEARRLELKARRDFLVPALERLGFGVPARPEGAFYVYADSSGLVPDSFELSLRLLDEAHVATTPGLDFGKNASEKYLRVAYTQPQARLEEALERVKRVLARG